MAKRKKHLFIAPRETESDDEQRLREALSRLSDSFMAAVDGSIALREADGETSRMRALARASLGEACRRAMEAQALSRQ